MPRHFAYLGSYNVPKNALHRAALEFLQQLSRRVVPGTVSGFIDALTEEMEKLSAQHSKCSPIRVHAWPISSGWGIGLGGHFSVSFHLYEIKEDDDVTA